MATLTIGLSIILVAAALLQSGFAVVFARLLGRARPSPEARSDLPYVSVLLPLRGADAGLRDSLTRLLRQDYPHYDVRVVVDSEQDPAWAIAQDVARNDDAHRLCISKIQDRRPTCSLQNSALSQALDELDDHCDVVVIVDGDLVAHRSWLLELTDPLQDPTVGGAFGNRWFAPADTNWGSWVRYLWNAAAVVPMNLLQIPWGGCFAIRRSALLAAGLDAAWRRSMVQDAPAKSLLAAQGLTLRFVPSLMMLNRSHCDLRFAHDFIKRQLMWTRLYHPNFGPVLLHALATTATLVAVAVMTLLGIWAGQWLLAACCAGALVFYLTTMMTLTGLLERSVRRVVQRRSETAAEFSWAVLLKLPAAILLAQAVYLSAVLQATFRREVTWRGVTYRWRGPYDVAVVEDRPFYGENVTGAPNAS